MSTQRHDGADLCAFQDCGVHADQAGISNGAGAQSCVVPYGYITANTGMQYWIAKVGRSRSHNSTILQVCVVTHSDGTLITCSILPFWAQTPEPERTLISESLYL